MCRVPITGTHPNFFARDTIDMLQVKCPHHQHHSVTTKVWECNSDNNNGDLVITEYFDCVQYEYGDQNNNNNNNSKKRRRIITYDDEASSSINGRKNEAAHNDGSEPRRGCTWIGPLQDLQRHLTHQCEWETIICPADGCNFKCKRRDMDTHLTSGTAILQHMQLMKETITASYETKLHSYETKFKNLEDKVDDLEGRVDNLEERADNLEEQVADLEYKLECKVETLEGQVEDVEDKAKDLENKFDLERDHLRYVNDCRSWIEHAEQYKQRLDYGSNTNPNPNPLSKFKIHPILGKKVPHADPYHEILTGLLCCIPGLPQTDWEGAMIPLMIRYSQNSWEPPKCSFPRGFFHPNVYPSGRICERSFYESTSKIRLSLPELLLMIQQRLSKYNINCPAQSEPYKAAIEGPQIYAKKIKAQAKRYSEQEVSRIITYINTTSTKSFVFSIDHSTLFDPNVESIDTNDIFETDSSYYSMIESNRINQFMMHNTHNGSIGSDNDQA